MKKRLAFAVSCFRSSKNFCWPTFWLMSRRRSRWSRWKSSTDTSKPWKFIAMEGLDIAEGRLTTELGRFLASGSTTKRRKARALFKKAQSGLGPRLNGQACLKLMIKRIAKTSANCKQWLLFRVFVTFFFYRELSWHGATLRTKKFWCFLMGVKLKIHSSLSK